MRKSLLNYKNLILYEIKYPFFFLLSRETFINNNTKKYYRSQNIYSNKIVTEISFKYKHFCLSY
jgi:Fic family protein